MRMTRVGSLLLLVLAAELTLAQVQSRIPTKIDREAVALRGNVHRLAQSRFDRGPVADSVRLPRITLFFNRTPAQQAELEALLQQQHDPSSPNYRKWLTGEQYAQRFGISEGDMEKAAQWLQAQGFTIVERAPGRAYIAFSGTAAQVRAAFGTEIRQYVVNGDTHFANASEPSLPRALGAVTLGIRGLHDFRPKARATRRPQPRFTSSISGNHFLTPDDFATIYHLKPLYDQGIDGTGQWVAVMGQTDIPLANIATFRSLSGLPVNAPVVKNIPNAAGGVSTNDIGEADLDVEWAGAVARNATIVYVNAGTSPSMGVFDSMAYAINNQITVGNITRFAPVLSISYGACEALWTASDLNSFTALFQQANSQGQTVVGPSGDAGAGDCESVTSTSATHGLAVDFPASSAFVTAVGGTQFVEGNTPSQFWSAGNNSFSGSALSYIPETVWNETAANGGQLAGSGGGKSEAVFNGNPNAKPAWQTALTPNDGVRDVPDISLAGAFIHDGYLICASQQTPADCTNGFRDTNNNLDAIGGTSAGVPTFAGMVALLNQLFPPVPPLVGQGNINPRLYGLAAVSPDAFHDITTGDNKVPCTQGSPDCPPAAPFQFGYTAAAGYDLATGLGSVDGYNLISELAGGPIPTPPPPDFTLTAVGPPTLTIARGTSGTFTVSLAGVNNFGGNVTFSCIVPTSMIGVTCTPPAPMAPPGNAVFTITASPSAKLVGPRTSPTFLAWNWGGGMLVAGLLLGAGERRTRRTTIAWRVIAIALLVIMGMLAGCGGGSSSSVTPPPPPPPPPPESATVVLQGVNNADVHFVSITVNVN